MIDGTFVDDMLSLYPLMHVLLTTLHWESKCRKNVQCIFWFKLGYGMSLTFEISIIVRIVRWDPGWKRTWTIHKETGLKIRT